MNTPDYDDPRIAKAVRKAQRPWYQKKRFIIPLGLVAFIFVIPVFSSENNSSRPTSAPADTPDATGSSWNAPSDSASEGAPHQGHFGQPVSAGDLQLTVTAPRPVNDVIGSYYCTTVTYTNNGDGPESFNAWDWKMLDTEGVEVDSTIGGTKNYLGSGQVRPGGHKTGDVCFDKQGSGTPQAITYHGGLFSAPVSFTRS